MAMTDVHIDSPKKKFFAVVGLLLFWLSGFAVGKFNTHPNKTFEEHQTAQVQTQVQTQTNTQEKERQDINAQKSVDKALVKDVDTKTTTTTVKKPDGETMTTVTTETKTHVDNTSKSKSDTKKDTKAVVAEKQHVDEHQQEHLQTSIKSTETYSQPNWRLSVFAGADLQLDFSKGLNLSAPVSAFYGGEVDRRIIGPFWLGVMAMKSGPGVGIGGSVSMQF